MGADLAEGTVTLPVIFALKEGEAAVIRQVLQTPSPSPELLEAGRRFWRRMRSEDRGLGLGRGRGGDRGLELLPEGAERAILEAIASEVVGKRCLR